MGGDGVGDDPWSCADGQCPALKIGVDMNGRSSWQAFGPQVAPPNVSATSGETNRSIVLVTGDTPAYVFARPSAHAVYAPVRARPGRVHRAGDRRAYGSHHNVAPRPPRREPHPRGGLPCTFRTGPRGSMAWLDPWCRCLRPKCSAPTFCFQTLATPGQSSGVPAKTSALRMACCSESTERTHGSRSANSAGRFEAAVRARSLSR